MAIIGAQRPDIVEVEDKQVGLLLWVANHKKVSAYGINGNLPPTARYCFSGKQQDIDRT